jgi:ABC-type siderophore export system fused ATPase/permease subunit
MAAFALLAKLALMHVVIFVTANTGTRNQSTITYLFFMAGITIQFLMASIELELGTLVVVEIPRFPRPCVVA